MNVISLLNLVAFMAMLVAIFILWRYKNHGLTDNSKQFLILLVVLTCIHHFISVMEWSLFSKDLDPIEDLVQIMLPLLWGAFFYSIQQGIMQQILRESKQRYQNLYDDIPSMYFTVDTIGKIISVNRFGAEQLGYKIEELVGRPVFDVFSENDRTAAQSQLEHCISQPNEVHQWEIRKVRKDGSQLWVKETARTVSGPDGDLITLIVCRDITERKQAEDALQESNERLHSALVASHAGTWRVDLRTGSDTRDASLNQLLGLPAEPSTQPVEDWFTYMHPDDVDAMKLAWEQGMESGLYEVEHRLVRRDGQIMWVYDRGQIVRDDEGQLQYAIGAVMDITERKQAEDLVRQSQERLRNLAASLHAAREEERAIIARDIHDELGQTLTGLKMDLSWLLDRMPRNWKKLPERMQSMISLVDSMVDYVRNLSAQLRPAILDDLGLEAAIEWELEVFAERTNCNYAFDLKNGKINQDRDRDTAVFRIFQEALTNVARHAKATEVEVALQTSNSQLVLIVKDDGIGITEAEKLSNQSLGLIGMQERANAFGGTVQIETVKEGGTMVTLAMSLIWTPPISQR